MAALLTTTVLFLTAIGFAHLQAVRIDNRTASSATGEADQNKDGTPGDEDQSWWLAVSPSAIFRAVTALVRRDNASYINNLQDPAVKANGINVGGGMIIATIADLLKFSGVPL